MEREDNHARDEEGKRHWKFCIPF